MGQFLGIDGPIQAKQAFHYYENCQAVATVIDIISEAAANVPLVMIQNKITKPNHPLLELLKSPHPDYTGRLLMNVLVSHYLLTGECYLFAGGNIRQSPRILAPISPCNVTVEQQENGFAAGYQVSNMMYTGYYKRKNVQNALIFILAILNNSNKFVVFHLKKIAIYEEKASYPLWRWM